MQCINIEDHLNKTQPKNFAKTSLILKNPKNFSKTQNLGKKWMTCMINLRRKIIPEEENMIEAKDWVGDKFREREEIFGEVKSQKLLREIGEKSRWGFI